MSETNEAAAVWVNIDDLTPWSNNPRVNDGSVEAVADSIKRFGFGAPIIARTTDRTIIAGHTRLKAAITLGLTKVPVRFLDLDPADAALLALADNRIGEIAEWDSQALSDILKGLNDEGVDLEVTGFTPEELEDLLGIAEDLTWEKTGVTGSLSVVFGAPPFSVLDANKGYWMERKRRWKEYGFESHLGRSGVADFTSCDNSLIEAAGLKDRKGGGGGSIFDPVLCEILYSWFNVEGGTVLDPFAGGSVRGMVASAMGYHYLGHELRPDLVEANVAQYNEI